jgi:hypothetical protein
MTRLSEEVVKRRGGAFDLGIIVTLDLEGLDLDDVGVLQQCTALRELNLSGNRISSVAELAKTLPPQITHLDLSNNKISSLRGIGTFTQLQVLLLDGNNIALLSALDHLAPLRQLRSLRLASQSHTTSSSADNTWLSSINHHSDDTSSPRDTRTVVTRNRGNGICAMSEYMERIRKVLPMLHVIDGETEIGYDAAVRALDAMCADTEDAFATKAANVWLSGADVDAVEGTFRDSEKLSQRMSDLASQIRSMATATS